MSHTLNNTMISDTLTIGDIITPYVISTTGTGAAGQVLISNGTGANWITSDSSLQGATLHVKGNAEFEGNVKIKGKDLVEMVDKIESRLAILHPNPELEEKWENLRDLRKAYIELEAEIIEKEMIWNTLKK